MSATTALAATFARQLIGLRAERGETQRQLALRLSMTESMISRLESGAHLPSLTTLQRIAGIFERTLEITFHEHEHAHPDGTQHSHAHEHDDFEHRHDHAARDRTASVRESVSAPAHHEHEHEHFDGTRHAHAHAHTSDDFDHAHRHAGHAR